MQIIRSDVCRFSIFPHFFRLQIWSRTNCLLNKFIFFVWYSNWEWNALHIALLPYGLWQKFWLLSKGWELWKRKLNGRSVSFHFVRRHFNTFSFSGHLHYNMNCKVIKSIVVYSGSYLQPIFLWQPLFFNINIVFIQLQEKCKIYSKNANLMKNFEILFENWKGGKSKLEK